MKRLASINRGNKQPTKRQKNAPLPQTEQYFVLG